MNNTPLGFDGIGSAANQGWSVPPPTQYSVPPYPYNPDGSNQTDSSYPYDYQRPPPYPPESAVNQYPPAATEYPAPSQHYPPFEQKRPTSYPLNPQSTAYSNLAANNPNPPYYDQPASAPGQMGADIQQQRPQSYPQMAAYDAGSFNSSIHYPSLDAFSCNTGKENALSSELESNEFSRSSTYKNDGQVFSSYQKPSKYMETPLPSKTVLLWESHGPVQLFFIQEEGYIVSPAGEWKMMVHKMPEMSESPAQGPTAKGSLSGNCQGAAYLLTVGSVWRLGLRKDRDFSAKGHHNEFAFCDKSTSPERTVVIHFTKDIKKEELQRLEVLLRAASHLVDEPSNTVDTLETGVESAYNSVTGSVNTFVKGNAPSIHRNTKWIRKGTGTLVRFGGSLVSKGAHLVSDPFLEKSTEQVATNQHYKLFSCIENIRQGINSDIITYVKNSS